MENNEIKISNNIFKYATKELSQDAFLAWLVSWKNSKEKNKDLYNVADNFLKLIFEKANKEYKGEFEISDITRQEKNCDVLIMLENGYAIIIEDKIFTKEHDAGDSKEAQLKSYKTKIKNSRGIEENKIITVYYKMIDEADENKTADVIISREVMINILRKDIDNDIYRDYRNYLIELNNNIENIEEEPIVNWMKKPELFYTFEKKYKKIFKNINISRQHGSIFIDWDFQEFKPIKNKMENKMEVERIYLSVDLNYNKPEARIVLKEVKKYNHDSFNKIQERAMKYLSEFGDSVKKCNKAGNKKIGSYMETKRLVNIKMDKYFNCKTNEIKIENVEEIMEKLQDALKKMLEE